MTACPRCAGQLYEDSDTHGRYLSCLNCGYLTPIDGYDPEGKRETYRAHYTPRQPRLRGRTAKQRHP